MRTVGQQVFISFHVLSYKQSKPESVRLHEAHLSRSERTNDRVPVFTKMPVIPKVMAASTSSLTSCKQDARTTTMWWLVMDICIRLQSSPSLQLRHPIRQELTGRRIALACRWHQLSFQRHTLGLLRKDQDQEQAHQVVCSNELCAQLLVDSHSSRVCNYHR